MKICRFGEAGLEKPGLIDAEGAVRDLSGILEDITPGTLSAAGLAALRQVDPASLPVVVGSPRLGVPFTGTQKYVGIGLNYRDHAREAGLAVPSEPIIFLKAPSAICGPNDDTLMPVGGEKLDWEVELGVVIGTTARNVAEDDALDHVAGYCVLNDVSERAFQMQSAQWDKGKGCDTFGPTGPWLVTRDEVEDPQDLELWLEVNGQRMQSSSTAQMIFGVAALISYASRYMTLVPGDIIATGTPSGVALGRPDAWLKPGDIVRLGVAGLGEQCQRVIG
ncbi:fumarylacetoacetate hydrolase family protein [Terrihabitans rhizophilus]|uniref:Fumarylacetoacetate hydrolase family protein n=1 Tax=Terrihabitans rhizophilus TaxID=3092662 RepID=A0ABU4RMA2_9HYPH|nr:fumarylacetoacetate hydrolase family protein [Terrihabitans sp. PJ23]MDX6805957.1 fumarylacetoacetate hydrolase family protein [Terrihabitans sp. PJ23]